MVVGGRGPFLEAVYYGGVCLVRCVCVWVCVWVGLSVGGAVSSNLVLRVGKATVVDVYFYIFASYFQKDEGGYF